MDYKEQDSFRKLSLTWRRKDFFALKVCFNNFFHFHHKDSASTTRADNK